MSNTKIEILPNTFLKSEEVGSYIKNLAKDIASRCGEGYSSDVVMMPTRYIASVYTDSYDAIVDNKKNNTILKSLKG